MSMSFAFSPWIRGVVRIALTIPYQLLDEHTKVHTRLVEGPMTRVKLEQMANRWLQERKKHHNHQSSPSPPANGARRVGQVPASHSSSSGSSSVSSSGSASRAPSEHPHTSWWHSGVSALRGKRRTREMAREMA